MTYSPPSSAFTLVRRYFADPRVKDTPQLTVRADGDGEQPVRLTAAEAHEALYGPEPVPRLTTAIWKAALDGARAERTPHGHRKLMVMWLALPQLTGTAHRICRRLHTDRSDVEAEMVLALLEGLQTGDAAWPLSAETLVKRARTSGWRLARAGLREAPSAWLESVAENSPCTMPDETADEPMPRQGYDVKVDRPDGPDGLRASLRFRVCSEHMRRASLVGLTDGSRVRKGGHGARHPKGRQRVGSLSLRRGARHR